MKKEISKYLSEIGKKGGAKTSESKKKSSAENGKLGGRPAKKWAFAVDGNLYSRHTTENEAKQAMEDFQKNTDKLLKEGTQKSVSANSFKYKIYKMD